MTCSLCEKIAVDSFEVECGNNAEYSIQLNVCEEHLKESENMGYGFDEKYGLEFEKILAEKWC
jgi:hypothetical protein